jgi:hypothetical protein
VRTKKYFFTFYILASIVLDSDRQRGAYADKIKDKMPIFTERITRKVRAGSEAESAFIQQSSDGNHREIFPGQTESRERAWPMIAER